MPETARSKPLEIWFQDEARVGQQGTLTRIWAERGTRPRAPRDTRYIWSYIFGAVCPERAEAAALIMPHADTQAMSAHLAEIAKTVASGAHALLILDGAGWHGSAELEVPDNITLLKLPPYSPELNPMENVWAYLRANKLAMEAANVRLSRMNSGSTKRMAHPRDMGLFKTISDYPFESRRRKYGRARAVAEVCVLESVRRIGDAVLDIKSGSATDIMSDLAAY